ncbi:MAG: hypothetical protein CM1200mP9_05750 [Gammaproteobacteria bacterium]|nr:MAG: hypothetical protein CM1200mP9_05750 [Gammaproteobacteria bacterium]
MPIGVAVNGAGGRWVACWSKRSPPKGDLMLEVALERSDSGNF